jgi:hypothetical protein
LNFIEKKTYPKISIISTFLLWENGAIGSQKNKLFLSKFLRDGIHNLMSHLPKRIYYIILLFILRVLFYMNLGLRFLQRYKNVVNFSFSNHNPHCPRTSIPISR